MRKTLDAVGLAALAVLVWITLRALYGPAHLPGRIPTHFKAAGQPDGWGSPVALLILPCIALAIYALMTIVGRNAAVFNYPVRVTPRNRARLEALALSMIAWIKVELACIFAVMQWFTLRVAVHPQQGFPAALMPVTLVAVFGTVAAHIAAMFLTPR